MQPIIHNHLTSHKVIYLIVNLKKKVLVHMLGCRMEPDNFTILQCLSPYKDME